MKDKSKQKAKIDRICKKLNSLLSNREISSWEIGDQLVELSQINVGGKPLTLKQLHRDYLNDYSYPYLSQLRSTALTFPPVERQVHIDNGHTWYDCDQARLSRNQCVKAKVAKKDEPLSTYLDHIKENRGKRKINQRSLMKKRIEEAAAETQQRRALDVESLRSEHPDWLTNCHHASCLDIMDSLGDKSIDLVAIDPPYGSYQKVKDGRFVEPETKGLESECDNKTRDKAVKLTLGIIERSARILKENGKILLYQAATEPDRPEVIMLLKRLGFETVLPMYWKKKISQPNSFKIPFSHETERILVAARSRKALETPLGSAGRTDVITDDVIAKLIPDAMEYEEMPPSRTFYHEVQQGEANYGDRHFFEKPLGINKFFLEKLTLPGDTVIDVCGCTGSMIQACIEMDRSWIYCESNDTNYNLGVSRIGEVIERVAGIKSDDDDAPIFA